MAASLVAIIRGCSDSAEYFGAWHDVLAARGQVGAEIRN
jgi:hypothetical protein